MNSQPLAHLKRLVTLSFSMLVFALLIGLPQASAAPSSQSALYEVTEGDTWQVIALRFDTTLELLWQGNAVVNPLQLTPGQQLFIPGVGAQSRLTVSEITLAQSSDLLRVAAQSDTLVASLEITNNTQRPFIANGTILYIPDTLIGLRAPPTAIANQDGFPGPTPRTPSPFPTVTSTPPPPLARDRLGAQGQFMLQGNATRQTIDVAALELGAGWIKQQIVWKNIEAPTKGNYRPEELEALDNLVNHANNQGVKVLLSVVGAPDWARPSKVNSGPPADYADLASFMGFLANRYRGRVHSYEVWNEPNLAVEWTDYPISGTAYVQMLSLSYAAIKANDPAAIVVSAGLAPASNTAVSADDRSYMRQMFDAGLVNYVDVIGIHPYGAGNSPSASFYSGNPGNAPSHNDHPSFFLRDNISDYRAIQAEYGASNLPLWATEFGWPSGEHIGIGPGSRF